MKKRTPYPRRRGRKPQPGRPPRPTRHPSGPDEYRPEFRPRVGTPLRPVLREIGIPEDRPFEADPFQVDALSKLDKGDVIVSAPTGSGKTYIAVEAMKKVLAKGGRCWYASPLKALSNSKFIEFGGIFGSDRVGLLTGDHKVNSDAPLIVGTTEILRNQLYDAMSKGEDLNTDIVVMDEAHYLGDPDRGVVWEEVLIYLPPRVRLLLLSATVANARDIATWLSSIRKAPCRSVITHQRPVPLHPLFLFPDGELTSLARGQKLNPQIRHFVEQRPERGYGRGSATPPFGRIIRALGEFDLLPAIFFLKSRSDCDAALLRSGPSQDYIDQERRFLLEDRLDELLEKYPFLKTHAQLRYIRGMAVASHHAGQMPHFKVLVEHLMQEGLLNAIFSTSTVAAGVNFPARTVVISQSDRFNGREFQDLSATELLQMTGRAGRRGMDRIGFALTVPGPFQDVRLIHSLFNAPPDPVESQIQINFSMVLNLLMSHRPEQIRELLNMSLAAQQQVKQSQDEAVDEILGKLETALKQGQCGGAEAALVLFQAQQRLHREARDLSRLRPKVTKQAALRLGLTPGRLFEVYGGQLFCAIELRERRGRAGVMAAKLKPDLGLKKGQVRQKWVPLARISLLLDMVLPIDAETPPRDAVHFIQNAADKIYDPLDLNTLAAEETDPALASLEARSSALAAEQERMPCTDCEIAKDCLINQDGRIHHLLNRLNDLDRARTGGGRLLWTSFLRHLAFLKAEGFVDDNDELTSDGLWAARLRLDHPLIFAAGIRQNVWPQNDPALLAAMVAPYVQDREPEPGEVGQRVPPELAGAWGRLEISLGPLTERLKSAGFLVPELTVRPALAMHLWSRMELWDDAVRVYGRDPGDMAMLVFRTADHLRQMAGLSSTHPELASAARQAVDMIMKEPVIAPL
jgi:ATP-dependent RNA helicase HelY